MSVTVDLRETNKRVKALKTKMNSLVFQLGTRAKLLIVQNHLAKKGADDKTFKKLTPSYKKKKEGSGRGGDRTLSFTGALHRGLNVFKAGYGRVKLRFNQDQLKKARGNVKHAPNMLVPVSERIDRRLQKLAFKLWEAFVR